MIFDCNITNQPLTLIHSWIFPLQGLLIKLKLITMLIVKRLLMIPRDSSYNGAINLLDDIRLELIKNPFKDVMCRGNDEEEDAL